MANPEHLAILKQGVEQWNKWRSDHVEARPDLSGVALDRTAVTGVNLRWAVLVKADLNRTNLTGADLFQADLGDADLSGACFGGANLTQANLCGANLTGADLWNANLSGSCSERSEPKLGHILMWTVLRSADVSNADFSPAIASRISFDDLDLSNVSGLETIHHTGPSTVGIDTISKSRGKIPEVFLRGCGVPDEFIAYIGSMVGRAIEFYSCFISYSSKDQEFAERLHGDLQSKGVRCWFAPEDLKIGDRFQERIEESIRVHDKLLLVLSENSVVSPWVEREVQAAFEREDRSKKLVLFPIRVDEAVMEASKAWAADIRRTRHIGEFGNWREHESYKKGLERLLRDLKNSG